MEVLLRIQSRKLAELTSFCLSQLASDCGNIFLLHSCWSPRPLLVFETSLICSFLPVINALSSSHIYFVVKFLFFLFPDSPSWPASNCSSSRCDCTVTTFWVTYHIKIQGCLAASPSRQWLNSLSSSTFLKKLITFFIPALFPPHPITRHRPLLPLFLHHHHPPFAWKGHSLVSGSFPYAYPAFSLKLSSTTPASTLAFFFFFKLFIRGLMCYSHSTHDYLGGNQTNLPWVNNCEKSPLTWKVRNGVQRTERALARQLPLRGPGPAPGFLSSGDTEPPPTPAAKLCRGRPSREHRATRRPRSPRGPQPRTWAAPAGWSGSCSAAAAGSGSAAAGRAAAAGAAVRSWSPSAARSSPPSGRGECTGGTSASSPGAWGPCTSCCGACRWGSWDGFAVFEKKRRTF